MSHGPVADRQETVSIDVLRPSEFCSWDALVSRSPHGTVFHYSWWLEATGYDFEILVCREASRITAGIPLPRKRRAGLMLFHAPPLTPFLGPIFDLSSARSACEEVSSMRRLGELLAGAIKGYDSFIYTVGAGAPDLQGFLWAGYQAALGYTFRFEADIPPDQVLASMAKGQRGALTKAQRRQSIVDSDAKFDTLLDLVKQSYIRQGLSLPYDDDLPRRLWDAAHARGLAQIVLARSQHGPCVAGLLAVHDPRTTYLLLEGTSTEGRSTGGVALVEWEVIQDALRADRAWDYEGSELRGVEPRLRHWGAAPKPVWHLARAGSVRGVLAQMLLHSRTRRQQRRASDLTHSSSGNGAAAVP